MKEWEIKLKAWKATLKWIKKRPRTKVEIAQYLKNRIKKTEVKYNPKQIYFGDPY